MYNLSKKSVVLLFTALPLFVVATPFVSFGEEMLSSSPQQADMTAGEVMAYWTPERMATANANPLPMPILEPSHGQSSTEASRQSLGEPGFANGRQPLSTHNAWKKSASALAKGGGMAKSVPLFPATESLKGNTDAKVSFKDQKPKMAWGGPPGNWISSYPGPFQRWTWYGRYLTYPTSTIGKLFFTQNGSNHVCSASVIESSGSQQDVIATAGHCVNDGAGNWSTNVLFCPSYNASGINPAAGCWTHDDLISFTAWTANGYIEADVACIVAKNTGTVIADHVGNVTGTLGRAWNLGYEQPFFSFGYPADSPFTGVHIVAVAGPGWYDFDEGGTDVDGSSLADTQYMGNDMTGGCSGGPWIVGLGHKAKEYADTDSSDLTDPYPQGQGWITGVNSHRYGSQEMASPQFTDSYPDTEGLWDYCGVQADNY